MRASLFRSRSIRGALVFSALLGCVLAVLPLTSVVGPESALVLGLLLSPCAALVGVRMAHGAQGVGSALLLSRAIGVAWLLLLVPLFVLALNALRVEPCDPLGGLSFLALGPVPSVTLAAVLGVALGGLGRLRLALLLALLAPISNIARAIHDFLTTPAIFAFGHLFGYFPGTLYDRQVEVPTAWLWQRLATTVLIAGFWACVMLARDPQSSRLQLTRLGAHPLLCGWVALTGAVAFVMARASHELGYTTSAQHVAHALGHIVEGPRCRVVVPRELARDEAQRLAEECEFRVTQHERTLGVREPGPVTAYFFRSSHEKRALMGAARVYIAKPWRGEAYLQLAGFPHPVLAHELAHVVARRAAKGPFGVPGKLFGLIPEPTLVEGLAVAMEPALREELTPHQWAKAAKAAGVAPPLSALLGPGFLAQNQALAYTLAGSFLRWVFDTYGAAKVRAIYRSGDVEGTLKEPYAELEKRWNTFLETLTLPSKAEALAKLRFERPGVFSQVCPHLVERLEGELGAALMAGDLSRAERTCREVLRLDPHNSDTRARLASTLALAGEPRAAREQLRILRGPPAAPSPVIARAETALADAAYLDGDFARARSAYRALLELPQSEAELRQTQVKLLALAAGEPTRGILAEMLIGRAGHSPDVRTVMHLIRELFPLRADGLAYYLEARQLQQAGRYDLSLPEFETALARGLATPELTLEALRGAALAAFVTNALDTAQRLAERLDHRRDATLAQKAEAADLRARIAFRRQLLETARSEPSRAESTHAH